MNLFRRRQDEVWEPRRPGKSLWEYIDDLIGSNDRIVGRLDALTAKVGELLDENAEIRGDIGELANGLLEVRGDIMARFDNLSAKVDKLQSEVTEIVNYVNTEAGKLAALFAENQALTARIADLEPNQITEEDRAALAANEAKIQASIDTLNTFTPDAIPPVEENPAPEEPDVEPEPETPIEGQPR